MNKQSVFEMLEKYLSQIRFHSALISELVAIIAGSGYESDFRSLLISRLRMLSALGKSAVSLKEFELLRYTGDEELYSMHLSNSNFNIRILYAFLPNHMPVLLCAFNERSGKRKTDYSTHIPVALARLEDERRDYKNEPFRV